MSELNWIESVQGELENARSAREMGLEGRARVCARRAAGIIVREYCRQKKIPLEGSNAYQNLMWLKGQEDIPSRAHEALEHLTASVDANFDLPSEVDLIADVELLPQWLGLIL